MVPNLSQILHISSKSAVQPLTIAFDANLMRKVPCHINISMPINKSGDFSFDGKIEQGNFTDFNEATSSMGLKFSDGKLDNIVFKGNGNDKYASGKLTMRYKNLKVKILNNAKKDEKEQGKEQGFFSWTANRILKRNNPVKGKLRETTMYSKRIPYKGFPGFLWRTVFSGVKATLIPSMEKSNTKSVKKLDNTMRKP